MHEKTTLALNTLATKEVLILEDAEAGCLRIIKHGPVYQIEGYDLETPDDLWGYSRDSFEDVVEVLDRHFTLIDALEVL